jgi:hypothetical protein
MDSFKDRYLVLLNERLSDLPQLTFLKLKVKSVGVINNSKWEDDLLKADIRCFFSQEIKGQLKYEDWMLRLDEIFEESCQYANDQAFIKAMGSLNLSNQERIA